MSSIEFEQVTKRFEETVAVQDLSLKIGDGEFMIFVGPSGCGKTTALRMVAGLEEISGGSIRLGGLPLNDIEAADRDIAMVFQNYALYPHMSVGANLGFPLRMRRLSKAEVKSRVREVAQLLGIEDLLARKPRQLSGGQRQRVAMGRAIVRHPQAFLMDEPLSNLDAKLRVQMRAELVNLHRTLGVTTIYVTHDQTEAMTLGQRVTVLNRGAMQQIASPQELYDWPANTFVAGFIGSPAMNFIAGGIEDGRVRAGSIGIPLDDELLPELRGDSREVTIGLRPESFSLGPPPAGGTGVSGQVEIVEQLGSESLVYFRSKDLPAAQVGVGVMEARGALCARLGARTRLHPGDPVELTIRPDAVRLFSCEDGAALLSPPRVLA